MNLNYNPNIPGSQNNPSDDQGLMRTNTNSIRTLIAIDHHGFKDNLGGYHTIIHQDNGSPVRSINRTLNTPFANLPGNIAGIHQLFSANVITPSGTDTQLFSLTGGNGLSQITGGLIDPEGYQWIGGILVQWGKVTTSITGSFSSGTASGVVTYATRTNCIVFPSRTLSVYTTMIYDNTSSSSDTPSAAGSVSINQKATTLNNTQFQWQFNSNSSKFTGFYWWAIGQ